MYFLAIDGGGTKTASCIMNANGAVVAAFTLEGINPNKITDDILAERLQKLHAAFSPYVPCIRHIYAGVSGCMRSQPRQQVAQRLRALFPSAAIAVEHDLRAALFSGTRGAAGVVLIAGTGSVLYGLQPDGSTFRTGGWGPLFSDEGSGTDIGAMAVRAILRAHDRRANPTVLTSLVCEQLCLPSPDTLAATVAANPSLLPTLAPLVQQAALQQDAAAQAILTHAGEKLADLLDDTLHAYCLDAGELPIVLTGGILRSMSSVYDQLSARLPQYSSRFLVPEKPPLYGAAIACLQQAGCAAFPDF